MWNWLVIVFMCMCRFGIVIVLAGVGSLAGVGGLNRIVFVLVVCVCLMKFSLCVLKLVIVMKVLFGCIVWLFSISLVMVGLWGSVMLGINCESNIVWFIVCFFVWGVLWCVCWVVWY